MEILLVLGNHPFAPMGCTPMEDPRFAGVLAADAGEIGMTLVFRGLTVTGRNTSRTLATASATSPPDWLRERPDLGGGEALPEEELSAWSSSREPDLERRRLLLSLRSRHGEDA